MRRLLAIVAAAVLAGLPAEAYYHYVFYNGRSAPFVPIPAHFDLTALPYSTVTFFVDDNGPATFYPNDSFGSVLAEVRQAAAAWNSVESSALRVAFGGLESAGQTANTPGGDVVFQDLPPGILGLGTPNLPATPTVLTDANGLQFVPILRSTVILSNNTNVGPGPSFLEAFYTTAVHEFGHALGLQHTWTASAMSQAVIRNTSRARPIDADDIAALSVLYGAPNWQANFASISGVVTFGNGRAVSLASVVAIPPEGPAVSALTNPDGTYVISGLPPGTYQLYVHPLPPDAIVARGEGLVLPQDLSGVPFLASGAFDAEFWGPTQDPSASPNFAVAAGSNSTEVNFVVQARLAVTGYDMVTFSYLDPLARGYTVAPPSNYVSITPAYETLGQAQMLVFTEAAPSLSIATPTPQSISILGGFAPALGCAPVDPTSPCFYTNNLGIFSYFIPPASPGTGPRHMVFDYGDDMFVLPDAVDLVANGPPYISLMSANPDGTVTLVGGNFAYDSRVFFDGMALAGTVDPVHQAITVTPPSGASGQTSLLNVYNADGQNSLFFSGTVPPSFIFPVAAAPQIVVAPASLPAGAYAEIDIQGSNTNFVDGQVSVGFGSSDVAVSRVWVVDGTHLKVDVAVAPGAALTTSEISVISGFQVVSQPNAFQVLPANPQLPAIGAVVPQPGQTVATPGSIAVLYGANLSDATVTLNGAAPALIYASASQINFVVPAGTPTGPSTIIVATDAGSASLAFHVCGLPPTVVGPVGLASGATPGPGDVVTLQLSGLDPTVLNTPSRLQVTVSGIPMPVVSIAADQVQFALAQSFADSPVPVSVAVDGGAGVPFVMTIR